MIKKIQDYVMCFENSIDPKLCKKIITKSYDQTFVPALSGGGERSSSRNCYESPLDVEFQNEIFKVVGQSIQNYQEAHPNFITGLTTEDTGYGHLLYIGAEKGEYKEHVDNYDLHQRVLSLSLILNDDYDGGDFAFFEGQHIVKKQRGSVVAFPSNFCFPHAITPVSNGDRHAIITWIH